MSRWWVRLLSLLVLGTATACPAQSPPPDPETVRIDLRHILEGRVNSRGVLVGLHHEPSAPRTMMVHGRRCEVRFERTSPGGRDEVRTARVQLRDPETGRVVLDKFSTLFPDSWDRRRIEAAIREAYADALRRNRLDESGRWEGQTGDGVRIDGFLSYDGTFIASAFPVYERPRGDRRSR
ncbi:MAG: hypothetical protein KatS3mg108_1064 [Isosphaeraceae bacterium]|jgi:hypothetical protein|nr:MAG: hypothetical protein KatS3mg108_1064 [Isosphaeraceae bacterium]